MWLFQLALVIAACHGCGWIAERVGQCRVVGEIMAGILLGPSVLGAFAPVAYDTIFTQSASQDMSRIGEIGLIFLMFQIGLHLDLRRHTLQAGSAFRTSVIVALLGMAAPFAAGTAIAAFSRDILAPGIPALQYVLFCGIALSVSAVPVMARIVLDLRIDKSNAAAIALSAAMVTDLCGWMMLAAITSLSTADAGLASFVRTLGWLVVYVGACLLVSRLILRRLAGLSVRSGSATLMLTGVIAFVLISAWATSSLGLHSAFGALIPGILLRDLPKFKEQWNVDIDGFVRVVLMPVFFSYAGLHASFTAVDGYASWLYFCGFFCCGFIGKFGGSYLGARVGGLARPDAAIVGSLMNTRGLIELVILSIGLELNILPQGVYTILVMLALVTTAMTVPLVRFFNRNTRAVLV